MMATIQQMNHLTTEVTSNVEQLELFNTRYENGYVSKVVLRGTSN